MQEFVCCEDGAFFVIEAGAVNVGDAAACLFENYAACGDIPNFKSEFPGAVQLAGGYKAEVERG